MKKRRIIDITIPEAKQLLRLELAHDGIIPTRIKFNKRTLDGITFIVYTENYAPCLQGFTFHGRKCYASYNFLVKKKFDLTVNK